MIGPSTSITAWNVPRWRGFNLQPGSAKSGEVYTESDFAFIAEWGFEFVRLPLSYWTWGSRYDWFFINGTALEEIDRALELGHRYGIHVSLNFHRIPGYCVNDRRLEPADLFTDGPLQQERALSAAVFHWRVFAERYRGIPSTRPSFDLLNEPPKRTSEGRYLEIIGALVAGIREVDPDRLIFVDGTDLGQTPVPGVGHLGVVQSTRGYLPKA